MRRLLRSFGSSKSGNVIVLAACTILMIAGLAALVVDVGTFYYAKRHLQTAADMAALAASTDLSDDQAAALAALTSNGYSANVLQSVTAGTYSPSASLGNRFTAGGTSPNAVKVALLNHTPVHFAPVFALLGVPTNSGTVAIGAKSVGSTPAYASFAIGSTLASFNGGVLNAVLSALVGGNVSLQVMDYNALANANIDLFQFSNALATRLNLTGTTYSSIASGNFAIGDIFQAAITSAQSQGASSSAIAALQALDNAIPSTMLSKTVNLSSLVSFGPYGRNSVGNASPVAFQVSALNLMSSVLQLANGSNQIALDLGVNTSPLADVTLTLMIGQPPVGTSTYALGPTGASVYTAQTRLLFTAQIGGSGLPATITVPILINLAGGQASLASIQCNAAQMSTSNVTLNVTPSLANAWIGNVTNSMLTSLTTTPNPGPATILNIVGLVSVTGRANAAITNLLPTPVSFSYAQITSVTGQTTSTTDYVSSLLSNLFGGLVMQVNVVGLPLLVPPNLTGTIGTALAAATTPLDSTINSVLLALGLNLGQATTWVSGVTCQTPVVVQ